MVHVFFVAKIRNIWTTSRKGQNLCFITKIQRLIDTRRLLYEVMEIILSPSFIHKISLDELN